MTKKMKDMTRGEAHRTIQGISEFSRALATLEACLLPASVRGTSSAIKKKLKLLRKKKNEEEKWSSKEEFFESANGQGGKSRHDQAT